MAASLEHVRDVRPARIDPRVEAARGGDVRAFEGLYREHVARIHALCVRMAPDGADAEGLTQDAFVRAWEKLGGFRGASGFGTWLYRIAINTVLNHRRTLSRRAHGRPRADAAVLERVVDRRPVGRDDVDLDQAIAGLPERARMVFVLHDVEGYRHQEIADLMDLAPGTSKSQLHRARKLLREALQS